MRKSKPRLALKKLTGFYPARDYYVKHFKALLLIKKDFVYKKYGKNNKVVKVMKLIKELALAEARTKQYGIIANRIKKREEIRRKRLGEGNEY